MTSFPDDEASNHGYVTVQDEAFFVCLWENCIAKWHYELEQKILEKEGKETDAQKKAKAKENGEPFQDDPRTIPPYTLPKGGVQRFGGWNKTGRKRYREVLKLITEAKGWKGLKTLEQQALKRIQKKHNIDSEKAKKRRKLNNNKYDDLDSDHEPDWY